MAQIAGSAAFAGAAFAFVCMDDPILGVLAAICSVAWVATTSELRTRRMPRGEFLRRL
jgi:hypothetical protein